MSTHPPKVKANATESPDAAALDYTLVTNLLQGHSLPVLIDWLDFLPRKPKALICFFGSNTASEKAVADQCAQRGIDFVVAPKEITSDIRKGDALVAKWQFGHTKTPWVMRIALDTLAYSTDPSDWLSPAIEELNTTDKLFLTGSTKIYRTDKPTPSPDLFFTQRVSINFILIQPAQWIEIYDDYIAKTPNPSRFSTEKCLEDYCAENNVWGLRLKNIDQRRIFHVQEWGERISKVRDAFRKGRGIQPFLNGYVEDEGKHPWNRYFMSPKPPLVRRARIAFGAWRRGVFQSPAPRN